MAIENIGRTQAVFINPQHPHDTHVLSCRFEDINDLVRDLSKGCNYSYRVYSITRVGDGVVVVYSE